MISGTNIYIPGTIYPYCPYLMSGQCPLTNIIPGSEGGTQYPLIPYIPQPYPESHGTTEREGDEDNLYRQPPFGPGPYFGPRPPFIPGPFFGPGPFIPPPYYAPPPPVGGPGFFGLPFLTGLALGLLI